jgi:hypothetical protein
MGLLKKIKRKAKSIVRKIVPKEIAGIARVAAPFVGAKFGLPAALATSVAGQLRSGEGRINPLETVLAVAPSRGFRDFVTQKIPGGGRLDEILYGTQGSTSPAFETLPSGGVKGVVDVVREPGRGIFGIGGKFNPLQGTIIRDKKTGDVKLTNVLGLIGSGLTFLQAKAAIRREGEDLGLDESEIVSLEGQLLDTYFPGFDPTGFRPDVPGRKDGGLMRTNFAMGTKPTPKESGLGGLPIEADMRYTGGFMPYGAKEKADDVPARLSKNEFVFTADAVRAAGGGDINMGARRMYNTMKQLESMGRA